MNPNSTLIVAAITGLVMVLVGILIGYLVKRYQVKTAMEKEQLEASSTIARAREEAREIKLEAENEALETRRNAEREVSRRRTEITREDDRLQRRNSTAGLSAWRSKTKTLTNARVLWISVPTILKNCIQIK
jgi:ribonuclease Y